MPTSSSSLSSKCSIEMNDVMLSNNVKIVTTRHTRTLDHSRIINTILFSHGWKRSTASPQQHWERKKTSIHTHHMKNERKASEANWKWKKKKTKNKTNSNETTNKFAKHFELEQKLAPCLCDCLEKVVCRQTMTVYGPLFLSLFLFLSLHPSFLLSTSIFMLTVHHQAVSLCLNLFHFYQINFSIWHFYKPTLNYFFPLIIIQCIRIKTFSIEYSSIQLTF